MIPGKHGGPAPRPTTVFVAVPDHPGELARLLPETAEIGVNIEDLRIDHDPGRDYGLVELQRRDRVRRPPARLARRPGLDDAPVRVSTGSTTRGLDRLDHRCQLHCQVNSTSAALPAPQGWSPRVIQ